MPRRGRCGGDGGPAPYLGCYWPGLLHVAGGDHRGEPGAPPGPDARGGALILGAALEVHALGLR